MKVVLCSFLLEILLVAVVGQVARGQGMAGSSMHFKSTALDTDGEFSFVFSKPGTYKYFCSVHPRMVGTVVVEDSKPNGSMK